MLGSTTPLCTAGSPACLHLPQSTPPAAHCLCLHHDGNWLCFWRSCLSSSSSPVCFFLSGHREVTQASTWLATLCFKIGHALPVCALLWLPPLHSSLSILHGDYSPWYAWCHAAGHSGCCIFNKPLGHLYKDRYMACCRSPSPSGAPPPPPPPPPPASSKSTSSSSTPAAGASARSSASNLQALLQAKGAGKDTLCDHTVFTCLATHQGPNHVCSLVAQCSFGFVVLTCAPTMPQGLTWRLQTLLSAAHQGLQQVLPVQAPLLHPRVSLLSHRRTASVVVRRSRTRSRGLQTLALRLCMSLRSQRPQVSQGGSPLHHFQGGSPANTPRTVQMAAASRTVAMEAALSSLQWRCASQWTATADGSSNCLCSLGLDRQWLTAGQITFSAQDVTGSAGSSNHQVSSGGGMQCR